MLTNKLLFVCSFLYCFLSKLRKFLYTFLYTKWQDCFARVARSTLQTVFAPRFCSPGDGSMDQCTVFCISATRGAKVHDCSLAILLPAYSPPFKWMLNKFVKIFFEFYLYFNWIDLNYGCVPS